MKTTRLTTSAAVKFYRRFDYGYGSDNYIKDVVSAVVLGIFCTAFVLWLWVLSVAVAAYRAGYPL